MMNFEDLYIRLAHLDEQIELLEETAKRLRDDVIHFNAMVAGVLPNKIAKKPISGFSDEVER
jgi:hypothetical protein